MSKMSRQEFRTMVDLFNNIQDENKKFADLGINLLNTTLFNNYYELVSNLWNSSFGNSAAETLQWYFLRDGHNEISLEELYQIVVYKKEYQRGKTRCKSVEEKPVASFFEKYEKLRSNKDVEEKVYFNEDQDVKQKLPVTSEEDLFKLLRLIFGDKILLQ